MKIGIQFELTLEWVTHQQKLNSLEDLDFTFEDKKYLFDYGSLYIMKTFEDVLGSFEDWSIIYSFETEYTISSDLEHEILNQHKVLECFRSYVVDKISNAVGDNTIIDYVEILNYN